MKTNFLNKLKQGLFLLIAVLGTFISYAQSTQNPTIGGSRTPDTSGLLDIGGKQVPPITPLANSPVASHSLTKVFEIGGIGGQERRNLAVGGIRGNQVPPRRFCSLCVGLTSEIGGQGTTRSYSDIGGKDSSGGLGKYSSAVGLKKSIDHNSNSDIGGRSTGGEYTISDIGGNQGPPRQVCEINSFQVSSIDFEIGGQGSVPPRSVFEVTPITVPIGGNSAPRA